MIIFKINNSVSYDCALLMPKRDKMVAEAVSVTHDRMVHVILSHFLIVPIYAHSWK